MKENHFYGQRERMARIYDSLKNFVGNNEVHKPGDMLCVSSNNNGVFDTFIVADGIHTFIEQWKAKQEEGYTEVTDPSALDGLAGGDVLVKSNEVANAFSGNLPYFMNIMVEDAEVSQTVTMKAKEKITLDNIVISGEKGSTNGKITYAAKELNLRNITAKENATLYNAFEGYQSLNNQDYKGLERLVAENLNIDCPSIKHNIINVYTPASGADILVRNSKFNLTVDNSNPLRLANYMNAENVTVTFDNVDWTYENSLTQNEWKWAGLVIFQPATTDVALTGDLSKVKTWVFRFRNCRYNGQKITANSFGQHGQAFYLYNVGNTGLVTDPVAAGLNVAFE